MTHSGTHFGLMLPHFGELATRERVIGGARRLEEIGYESVWMRDHLTFVPHGFESLSTKFFEPFTTLSAIAATTSRLVVGTAVLVPMRHPLISSQLLGGLSLVAGPGRLIVGMGAGNNRLPIEATGGSFDRRMQALKESVEIFRRTWTETDVTFEGELYRFSGVTIDPNPGPETPIWIGGSTPAAVRRAIALADGWLPGRCALSVFDERLLQIREAEATQSKDFGLGIMPLVSVGRTREAALAAVDVQGLLNDVQSRAVGGQRYETIDDLQGILIAGTPDDCQAQVAAFIERGVDQVILDLRLRKDDFDEQAEWLAEEVLQAVRPSGPPPRSGSSGDAPQEAPARGLGKEAVRT